MNQWTIPALILYIVIFGPYLGYIVYHLIRGRARAKRTRAEFGLRPEDEVSAVPIGIPVNDAPHRRVRLGLIAFLGLFEVMLVLSAHDNRGNLDQFLIDAALVMSSVAVVTFFLTASPKAPVVVSPQGIYARKGPLRGGDTFLTWREVEKVAFNSEDKCFVVAGPGDKLPSLGPGEVTDDWEGISINADWPNAGRFVTMALKMIPEDRWSAVALRNAGLLGASPDPSSTEGRPRRS